MDMPNIGALADHQSECRDQQAVHGWEAINLGEKQAKILSQSKEPVSLGPAQDFKEDFLKA